MRTVVVGASSGLGRCIAVGLAQRGSQVAMLARRRERLEAAVAEAGPGSFAVECDVTDTASVSAAIAKAAAELGGIDALVYTPAIGPLARLADVDVETWRQVFDTNVIGAALVTAAALPHLRASGAGTAVYLSSVSASQTPPWPGLGAYAVSKAALDKLVEAWRVEHPNIGFTRLAVGDSLGGTGDSQTEFNKNWDPAALDRAIRFWMDNGYMQGGLVDADHLVGVVHSVLDCGNSSFIPYLTLAPRPADAVKELRQW